MDAIMDVKILWMHYFDCSLPRRLGRKLPKHLCIERPKPDEILDACKEIGISCEYLENKKYPRIWYKLSGMILAHTAEKKYQLLKKIAVIMLKRRRSKTST
jgi:signal recognition particle subunit SRP19